MITTRFLVLSLIFYLPSFSYSEEFLQIINRYNPFYLLPGCRNRLDVRFGNRRFAEREMAFRTLEFRVLFTLVNLEIQYSAVVRGRRDMAHVARRDRNFFR